MNTRNEKQTDVQDDLGELLKLPTVRAEEFNEWGCDPTTPKADVSEKDPETSNTLSDPEIRYMQAIVQNPNLSSSRYPKLAKVSPGTAKEIRSRLLKLGFIREHRVNMKSRGRSSIVLEVLKPALQILEQLSDWQGSQE